MVRSKGWLLVLITALLILGALPTQQALAQVTVTMACSGDYAVVSWAGSSGYVYVDWVPVIGPPGSSGLLMLFSGSYVVPSAGIQVDVTFTDSSYGPFPQGNITCAVPTEEAPTASEPTPEPLTPDIHWNGEQDGRLNPDAGENFSLYCADDLLNVWAGGGLLAQISLRDLIFLRPSGATTQYTDSLGGMLTVARSGDTITVAGPNGYFGPSGPPKTFSLRDCLRSNHGPLFGSPCKYCDL